MCNNLDFLSKLIRGELGLESPTPIRYQYFAQDLSANTLSHWIIPASTKADWSLSNILPLLFLRLQLHNLIIFCTLINSQLLNVVLPQHLLVLPHIIYSSSAALRTETAVMNIQSVHTFIRTDVIHIWLWQTFTVVPFSRVSFEPAPSGIVVTFYCVADDKIEFRSQSFNVFIYHGSETF